METDSADGLTGRNLDKRNRLSIGTFSVSTVIVSLLLASSFNALISSKLAKLIYKVGSPSHLILIVNWVMRTKLD